MVAPVAPAHADGAEWDRKTPGMPPHLRRLKPPKPYGCSLCMIATLDTNSTRNFSIRAMGPSGSYLSTRTNMIWKTCAPPTMNSVMLALSFSGRSPWPRVREPHAAAIFKLAVLWRPPLAFVAFCVQCSTRAATMSDPLRATYVEMTKRWRDRPRGR